MRKVSSNFCGILWPSTTSGTYEVIHDVETGEVTIDTGDGAFQTTLDENNCGQGSECLTSPDVFCSDGCTYDLVGCFSEGDPPTLAGTAYIDVHDPDGGLCDGPISCTVIYEFSGERASTSTAQRTTPSFWRSLGSFFARLGRALGLVEMPKRGP